MSDFYQDWLGSWEAAKKWRKSCRTYIRPEELEWVRTAQDWKAALMCDRSLGFATAGNYLQAIIPKGWHTGKHSHGEECMYILEGTGFSAIDGKRYDWEPGSALFMPFGSVHQHYNTGAEQVRYLSAMTLEMEKFAGIGRVIHLDDAAETAMGEVDSVPKAESPIDPQYGRIVINRKDAPVILASEMAAKVSASKDAFTQSLNIVNKTGPGHHAREIRLVRADNGFKATEVEMTGIMCDSPGKNSGKHGHMEAVIYWLQGEGYSVIGGERIDWKQGTLLHVQGPQTPHQHFNTGTIECQFLRTHYGLRSHLYQPVAKRVFPVTYYELSPYK